MDNSNKKNDILKEIKDDLNFIKELSHKRNTQENDSCANPVFWMIYDKNNVYNENGEYFEIYEDGEVIYSTYEDFNEDKLKEFKEHILDNYLIKQYEINEFKNIENNDDLNDFFSFNEIENICLTRFDRVYHISDMTGPFLTKEAAKQHIKENSYHYSKDVATYGMVGWRNPEFEKLMDIVSKMEIFIPILEELSNEDLYTLDYDYDYEDNLIEEPCGFNIEDYICEKYIEKKEE